MNLHSGEAGMYPGTKKPVHPNPEIPKGWRELNKHEVIGTDDKIWDWGGGPWKYVGGSVIGERYNRPGSGIERHWTIIREET